MKLSASSEKAPRVAPENLAPFISGDGPVFPLGRARQPERYADSPVQEILVLNRFQAGGLVQSAFYLGCFLFAKPAAIFMQARLQGRNRYWADAVRSRHVSVLACNHCR